MKVVNRIKKNSDFDTIIKGGKCIREKNIALYQLNNDLGYARIGISVQTKLGNAVKRNKARRQLKAIINQLFDLNVSKDYVFIIYKGYNVEEYDSLKESVTKIISKLDTNKS